MPLPMGDDFRDSTNELGWLGSTEYLQEQECEQCVFYFMFNGTSKTRYYLHNLIDMKRLVCCRLGGGNKAENGS
jgi:hypothetical protein